jgi:hypothetical protein
LIVNVSNINQDIFKTVPIADLVPTQVTVGMREVEFKRKRWREKDSHQAANYLNTHRFPVVVGPDARHYLIDRHHLTLAKRRRDDLGASCLYRRRHEWA